MYFTNVLIHPSFLYMYFQGARLYVFFFLQWSFLEVFFGHFFFSSPVLVPDCFQRNVFFNMLSHLTLAYESF